MERPANAEQAQRWNGESGRYWIAHRERHETAHQRLTAHLLRGAAIAPGDQALDVGCGCGATTIAAARAAGRAGPHGPGRVLGLDLSAPMLEVARGLAAGAGVTNAGFEQGDAQVYPLRRDHYDVAISRFGVLFFDDPAAAFANIAAAVRPGGRLAFLCWQDDRRNEVFAIPLGPFLAHVPRSASSGADLFADPRYVTGLLTAAGWADIRIDALTEPAWMGADVADVMGYVRGMRMVRGFAAELADEALTERILAEVAAQYAARQRADGVWVSAAVWLVTARRP